MLRSQTLSSITQHCSGKFGSGFALSQTPGVEKPSREMTQRALRSSGSGSGAGVRVSPLGLMSETSRGHLYNENQDKTEFPLPLAKSTQPQSKRGH